MKTMVNTMRGLGINGKIINLAVVSLTVFLFLLGVTCMGILLQEIVTGQELQPAILSLLTLLGMTAAGLVTISHAANNIRNAARVGEGLAQADRENQTAAVLTALDAAKQEIVQNKLPPTPL